VRRSDLRPGFTRPWQINGRSDLPFHAMVRFDYQYVAGWSLVRDLEILVSPPSLDPGPQDADANPT